PDRGIEFRCGKPAPIRAQRQGANSLQVSLEGSDLTAGAGIPEQDEAVLTTGREHRAIRAEHNAGDPVDVPLQGSDRTEGLRIPEPDGPIFAGRGQGLAIRAKGQVQDAAGVIPEDPKLLPSGDFPDSDRL